MIHLYFTTSLTDLNINNLSVEMLNVDLMPVVGDL